SPGAERWPSKKEARQGKIVAGAAPQACYLSATFACSRAPRELANSLISLVGAGRFELPTPSPPDWCANQAALRSEPLASTTYVADPKTATEFGTHLVRADRCPSLYAAVSLRGSMYPDIPDIPAADH